MRGKNGIAPEDRDDPRRRRANPRRGHGPFDNDRPAVAGVVGRDAGEVRLEVVGPAAQAAREEEVEETTLAGATVATDEGGGSDHRPERPRGQATVCHAAGEGAWDDDGDGVRAVHDNTLEGFGTGRRNSLGTFRGVSTWYLAQDVAIFQWGYNLKRVTEDFMRCLLGVPPGTALAS